MRRIFVGLFVFSLAFFTRDAKAQTVPVGYCGVQYTYDAAGNRIKRQYLCTAGRMANEKSVVQMPEGSDGNSGVFPNPTTGKFVVFSADHIVKADIRIINMQGQLTAQKSAAGHRIDMDISSFTNGVYFLHVQYAQKKVVYKIVKVSR